MKLFQKLLLTPAVIGFLTPISANASEASLMDVSNYSQVDVEVTQDTFKPLTSANPLLAGGEGLNQNLSNDFDGDTFSSTTSASFTTNFVMGGVDSQPPNDKTNFVFDYEAVLSSSFTGNDSLEFTLKSGNNAPVSDLDIFNSTGADHLNVDGITYTNQVGRLTYFVGNAGAPGSTLYTSACAYGGQTDVLDDCGIRQTNLDEGLGTSAGVAFDFGSGFTAALGYEGQNGEAGLLTQEGTDAIGAQLAYLGENFGVSFGVASIENHDANNDLSPDVDNRDVTTSSAVSAYFVPTVENFPSISIGMESTHDESAADDADRTSNYFVGVQWDELGQGTLGASVGSKAPTQENDDAEKMYEVFYSYNYADGITITPLLFVKENAASAVEDETGIFLKSTFSF